VNHYLSVLRLTSKYWAEEDEKRFRDIAKNLTLSKYERNRDAVEHLTKKSLNLHEVLELASFLNKQKHGFGNTMYLPVLFMGLMGMRMSEVLRLTWEDVNFKEESVFIHRTKNVASIRRLPLPSIVLKSLKNFKPRRAKIIAYDYNLSVFGKRLKHWMIRWDKDRGNIAPSDLRNSLITHAKRNPEWDAQLVDRFIGHSRRDLADRHYVDDSLDAWLASYREHLLPLINQLVEAHRPKTTRQKSNKKAMSLPDSLLER
jgi:integrase